MATRRSSVFVGQALFWTILLAACSTGAPKVVALSGKKGGKNTDSKNKPCQESTQQKLAGDALSLTSDDPTAIEQGKKARSPLMSVRNGGYLDVAFQGYVSGLPEFSDKGNEAGVVEVLQIPYCLKSRAFENTTDTWIRQCLNSATQEKLRSVSGLKSRFIQVLKREGAPKRVSKRCTAHFSMDYNDVMKDSVDSRVRVLSAEHCYQPSYHEEVTLQVYLPEEKVRAVSDIGRGVYVPIKLESDSGVWRQKVLAVGGGGGADGDSKLQEKILILRSMDGRTSDVYRSTFNKYCLGGKDSPFYPKFLDGKAPDTFDCYALSDLATFKGTLVLTHDIPLYTKSDSTRTPAVRTAFRNAAFQFIAEESKKNNSTSVDELFANRFPEFIRKNITVNRFATSLYDGIQHARRMRAFGEEMADFRLNLNAFSQYFLSPKTDVTKFDFSSPETVAKTLAEVAKVLTGTDGFLSGVNSFVCNNPLPSLSVPVFGGALSQDCMADFGPPDTARLEEIALNLRSPKDPLEFLGKRLNVVSAALINSAKLDKKHPLYIEPTDSQFRANLKILGTLYTFWLEVVLLHKEPSRGNPTMQSVARGMQEILKSSCSLQKLGAYQFPMLGNLIINDGMPNYSQVLPIRLSSPINQRNDGISSDRKLIVLPMGVSNPDDYQPNPCTGVSTQWSLGAAVPDPKFDGRFRPTDTVFGVYVNDAALTPVAVEQASADPLAVDKKLVDFISSRVVMKFEGSAGDSFQISNHSDSGTLLTFMGLPAFVLSARHGYAINGVVLAELPELNEPQPSGDSAGSICN